MKVVVTRDDIAWAIQLTSTQCGIAVALKSMDPNYVYPRVTHETIRFTDRRTGKRVIYPTPPHVARWIDDFDRGQARPITFTLPENEKKTRPIQHLQPSALARRARQQREMPVKPAHGNPAYRPPREQFTSTTGTVDSARTLLFHTPEMREEEADA